MSRAKRNAEYGVVFLPSPWAALSDTDRFITIDADNIVREDFFNVELDMSSIKETDVISWAGKNAVNGLVYGNGGIKCWPVDVVNRMRTHEAANLVTRQP